MSCIAIIPARGGSKRIPRKNIKEFYGMPIIRYSINAARKSKLFDEIMVSTDDHEIANLAIDSGASVPFFRSATNSNDYATTVDVIEEVMKWYTENDNRKFDFICCIYPAAPFITDEDLISSMKKLQLSNAGALVPIVKYMYPPQRSFIIEKDEIHMKWPENLCARSQDLEPFYHDAGQYYIIRAEVFFKEKTFFCEHTIPLILPDWKVQDIDNPEDWKMAEIKYKHYFT